MLGDVSLKLYPSHFLHIHLQEKGSRIRIAFASHAHYSPPIKQFLENGDFHFREESRALCMHENGPRHHLFLVVNGSFGFRPTVVVMAEVPVDFEVGIERENGADGFNKTGGSNGLSSSGSVDRNRSRQKSGSMENSAQHHNKIAKKKPDHATIMLAKQFFDINLPWKKKLKMLHRLATIQNDGTVKLNVPGDISASYQLLEYGDDDDDDDDDDEDKEIGDSEDAALLPPLQIVMLIVGTRGDVQPFIAIGKRLQADGHRVRLATHSNFKDFVLTSGLEFYPLGGDPKVLAAYMVKNKGFLPSGPSEIHIQRSQIKDIIFSLRRACTDPDPDTDVRFKANAIIANPPAYGHTHIAEALNIPIHIVFTMPWTPTSEFPHPLSRVKQPVAYKLTYQIIDGLIWLGIRDMIHEFRKKELKLRRFTYLSNLQSSPPDIPYAYIWSPHLVPKPKDWGPKIDVVGFCFLDLASNYVPPDSLVNWLNDGKKPIYIGFGSLPLEEPEKMTEIIVQALEITEQRGIINKGWGGLGNLAESKDFVYLLDNCPHDWLFTQCSALVHHGGAGTTAAGLKAACPATVIPFFGDQPFWGEQVHARGVGPEPIPVDQFSLEKLVSAIQFMLDPQVKRRAEEVARAMEDEDGVKGAVHAFYKQFPRESLKAKPEKPRPPSASFSFRSCFTYRE